MTTITPFMLNEMCVIAGVDATAMTAALTAAGIPIAPPDRERQAMTPADELRAALAKMTPGEWEIDRIMGDCSVVAGRRLVANTGGFQSSAEITAPQNAANAAGIIALRNLTPALLAERDALAAAVRKAAEVFQHYGDLHAAKPDPVKAQRNYDLAAEMRSALEANDD